VPRPRSYRQEIGFGDTMTFREPTREMETTDVMPPTMATEEPVAPVLAEEEAEELPPIPEEAVTPGPSVCERERQGPPAARAAGGSDRPPHRGRPDCAPPRARRHPDGRSRTT